MRILVYLGTGGVGKTSVAAATALAAARAGTKSMVLTIDPALRLRTALQLEDGPQEQRVPLDPPAAGELWAALLDVRAALDEAVRQDAKPETVDRILNHPIYNTVTDSLVGMQELMAVERIHQLRSRGFEHIVVDTAPSRHAIEFLDKPLYFAHLVGSPWVKLVGRTYKFVAATGMMSLGRKTLDIYARVEEILGSNLVRSVLDFYSLFVSIAESYAKRAEKTVAMLKDPAVTEFRVVTTPQKALRDGDFFREALRSRSFPLGTIYVNRMWEAAPAGAPGGTGLAERMLDWYAAVRQTHLDAFAGVQSHFGSSIPRIVSIPELARDVDGIGALEKIASRLGSGLAGKA
jgi:anion-transporting  ArsA/GET3 family ATPase